MAHVVERTLVRHPSCNGHEADPTVGANLNARAKNGRYVGPPGPSAVGTLKTARLLLIVLLPLALDIPFPLLASEFRRAFPLELVPVDLQRVLDGDLVTHQFPHG